MTPGPLCKTVVGNRLAWTGRMAHEIQALPLDDREEFFADRRNVGAAQSCLRGAREALLDLDRHIPAKGFGLAVGEYKEIANRLGEEGVLSAEEAQLLRVLAGYRNRLVRLYHEAGRRSCMRSAPIVWQTWNASRRRSDDG